MMHRCHISYKRGSYEENPFKQGSWTRTPLSMVPGREPLLVISDNSNLESTTRECKIVKKGIEHAKKQL